jgi:uncharacterized phage-associated protein
MALRYREDKTTQAAALLLKLHGRKMSHMKLLKLLYLADREALLAWGRPITFDWYYALPHGPVLSFTLNNINSDADPDHPSYWHSYISERRDHEVALLKDAPNDQLSPAEVQLLEGIFREYGHLDKWQLRDHCHTLPEWRDPEGSSLPIRISEILVVQGMTEAEARDVEESLEAEAAAERLLG